MLTVIRSIIGFGVILGLLTAVVLLMVVEWRRIRRRDQGLVPLIHRIRRVMTGVLMILLLGLCFYGWWFLPEEPTVEFADVFLRAVFSLLVLILFSLVWDVIVVYRSMDSLLDRINQTNLERLGRDLENLSGEEFKETGEAEQGISETGRGGGQEGNDTQEPRSDQ